MKRIHCEYDEEFDWLVIEKLEQEKEARRDEHMTKGIR
jgi:hypothetical protein